MRSSQSRVFRCTPVRPSFLLLQPTLFRALLQGRLLLLAVESVALIDSELLDLWDWGWTLRLVRYTNVPDTNHNHLPISAAIGAFVVGGAGVVVRRPSGLPSDNG